MDEPSVTLHRSRRAGYPGLVTEVFLDGRPIGLVFLSGTTPAEERTELWRAAALEAADLFLTEQEAVQRTVNQALRNTGNR